MNIELNPLTADLLPAIVELDRLCLGGLWSMEGYRRELESPNSDLLVFQRQEVEGREQEVRLFAEHSEAKNKSREVNEELTHLYSSCHHKAEASYISHPPLLGFGCLWAIADEAHITILAIHPEYRQQGLGQALLVALLKSAYQRELKWATLEVRASNQAALSLYQRFGFQEAGRRKRYYQDNGEDALILWRSGLQHPEFLHTLKNWQQQVDERLQQWNWMLSPSPTAANACNS